ncbi:MAG: hypothetical protein ABJD82_18575, partial [Marinobacter sp.]|uniref:hypothetical protein n=1 Tax=Marinobacter sp. TaxID=50741 RepID=UPI003267D255
DVDGGREEFSSYEGSNPQNNSLGDHKSVQGVRPVFGHQQKVAAVSRATRFAFDVDASLGFDLHLQVPPYLVKARCQQQELPRKGCSSLNLVVRPVHARLISDPGRHVDRVARVFA